jgi:general secretion pathway protein J
MKKRVKGLFSRRGGKKGFTLIEVVVTLTIVGFVLLIVFGVMRLGISAWEKGETAQEDDQRIRVLTQLFCRQIKSVVPYKIKSPKAEGDYLAFEGKAHSLKMVTALPLLTQRAEGFVFAVYELQEGRREGKRLVLYEQRALNKDFMDIPPKEESGVPILEELEDVRFEYFRDEDPEKTRSAEWVEEWDAKEEKELPKALRMKLILKKGKEKKETEAQPLTILVSLPSFQYEEVRMSPIRRLVQPQRPPIVSQR